MTDEELRKFYEWTEDTESHLFMYSDSFSYNGQLYRYEHIEGKGYYYFGYEEVCVLDEPYDVYTIFKYMCSKEFREIVVKIVDRHTLPQMKYISEIGKLL